MPSDHTPQRVVSLQPSATVILAAIGKQKHLVACTKYCADVCPEMRESGVKIVSDSWTADAKQIAEAAPELVIAAVPYQEKAVAQILKSGARFLGLAPKSLADIYTDIATISGIFDALDQGEQVIRDMQKEIAAMRERTRAKARPRVFCEEWGKPLIASQYWVAELVEAAGGAFVGEPGVRTSAEAVFKANPDVLVAAWCGAGERVPLEKLVRERRWSETNAAKAGRVYCIRDEFLNTPAPTLVYGLRALAAAIHPQDFPQASGLRCITSMAVGKTLSQITDMAKESKTEDVKAELAKLVSQAKSPQDLMSRMVKLLHDRMLKFNWVGFYMLEDGAASQPPMLVLGAFEGAMTPHTRIPLHQGICGAAASTGKTVVVDDVSKDPRYLACSLETKSEIVVPIFVKGKVKGELDIDSHFLAAFGNEERELVEHCAGLVGKHLEGARS